MGGPGSGGHNRKPDSVKFLEGNPGKRPLNIESDSPVKQKSPSCPKWIDGDARIEWRRICRQVKTIGEKDKVMLEGYCTAYATYRKAQMILDKQGLTQKARHGKAPRPEVKIAHDAKNQMRAFAIELGLTPRSKALKDQEQQTIPKSKFDQALGPTTRLGVN